jgi:hypothetical protein
MARHPASDERSVLGPPAKLVKGERFFVIEISAFLRCSPGNVAGFLRREGLLKKMWGRGQRPPALWTTARGMALCVAHFRAILGEKYQQGRDPLRERDRAQALALAKRAGYPPRG